MRPLFVYLFLMTAASGQQGSSPKPASNLRIDPFTYDKTLGMVFRRQGRSTREECTFCYQEHCTVINEARCDYYAATKNLLDDANNTDHKVVAPSLLSYEVDSLMFTLVAKASLDARYADCIPLVSQYTDCTKENICLGCKSCECDNNGHWSCNQVRLCSEPSPRRIIDHHVLLNVLVNMKNNNISRDISRKKRSITFATVSPIKQVLESNNITFEDLAEWMYGVQLNASGSSTAATVKADTTEPVKTVSKDKFDIEFLNDLDHEKVNKTSKKELELSDVAKWLQEYVNPTMMIHYVPTVTPTLEPITLKMKQKYSNTGNEEGQDVLSQRSTEILGFNDVLQDLNLQKEISSGTKPHYKEHNETTFDFDDVDYGQDTFIFNNKAFERDFKVNSIAKGREMATRSSLSDTITEPITNVGTTDTISNFLAALKNKNYYINRDSNLKNTRNNFNLEKNNLRFDNNAIDGNHALNIMKRSITNGTDATKLYGFTTEKNLNSMNATTSIPTLNKKVTEYVMDANAYTELRDGVLRPLSYIIAEKQSEINKLSKIKEKLLKYIEAYKQKGFELSDKINFTANTTKDNASSFSIYKLEFNSDNRNTNLDNKLSFLDSHVIKLKRDVYEVIKDVIIIQKLSEPRKMPQDLKFLIRAMKHYVQRQSNQKSEPIHKIQFKNMRRNMQQFHDNINPIKNLMIDIIQSIDKNMPSANDLLPLTPSTRKIVKRVIKRFYIDDSGVMGTIAYDPHSNITNELKNIGNKWQQITDLILTNHISERLYSMKLLQLEVSNDIKRMKQALFSLKITANRKFVNPLGRREYESGDFLLIEINNNLAEVHHKIMKVVTLGTNNLATKLNGTKYRNKPLLKNKVKMSFMNHVKNLLQTSKRDILGILRRRLPKAGVFHVLGHDIQQGTRRKLADYEDTMQKWQNNLGVIVLRNKRSPPKYNMKRGRIIIPKYLRGKVNPGIMKKFMRKNEMGVNSGKSIF